MHFLFTLATVSGFMKPFCKKISNGKINFLFFILFKCFILFYGTVFCVFLCACLSLCVPDPETKMACAPKYSPPSLSLCLSLWVCLSLSLSLSLSVSVRLSFSLCVYNCSSFSHFVFSLCLSLCLSPSPLSLFRKLGVYNI